MKEELINSALQAFITGAQVAGHEAKLLVDEVLNYLMFQAALNVLTSAAWGILVIGILKIIRQIHQFNDALDKSVCDEKIAAHQADANEAKPLSQIAKGESAAWLRRHDSSSKEYHLGRIEERKRFLLRAQNYSKTVATAAAVGVITFYAFHVLAPLYRVGKLLIAPRLVLVQEGAELLKQLQAANGGK